VKLACLALRGIGECSIACPCDVDMLVDGISSGLSIFCRTSGFSPRLDSSSATFLINFLSFENRALSVNDNFDQLRRELVSLYGILLRNSSIEEEKNPCSVLFHIPGRYPTAISL
jgi:hypothetical protein